MISVHAPVDIAVLPERVWRVLMDFARYRNWHPYVEMEGVAIQGGEMGFSFRNNPAAPRGWKTEVTVTQLEPPSIFAFKFGLAGLFTMEQWYSLEEIPDGARLTHGSNYGGFLPAISARFIRKRLLTIHQVTIERLARGFVKSTKPQSQRSAKTPPKPRKGFRGYRR